MKRNTETLRSRETVNNHFTEAQIIGKTISQLDSRRGKTVARTSRKLMMVFSPSEFKEATLTAEQQARQRIAEMKEYFSDKPIECLGNAADGTPWTLFRVANKACYSLITEDLRAEHMDIFLANYPDMLMNALTDLCDAEKLDAVRARMVKKHPEETEKQIDRRMYFNTAQNAVKRHIDQNRAVFYRRAVNEQGLEPSKEEKKTMNEARSSHYAANKYEPEVIDQYYDLTNWDTGELHVSVYAYHAPVERYNQRVATVNQDETYKASTNWSDSESFASDYGSMELAISTLNMNLDLLLKDKPSDLKVAKDLLAGIMSTSEFGKISPRRRARIRAAFFESAAM